jgi:hypothetical protein
MRAAIKDLTTNGSMDNNNGIFRPAGLQVKKYLKMESAAAELLQNI